MKDLTTVTLNGKRHYVVKSGSKVHFLPSVTTILGEMTDHSGIDEWKERVGEVEANKISKFSTSRGTCMHVFCEIYLDEKIKDIKTILKKSYDRCIEEGFNEDHINNGRKLFYNFYHAKSFDRIKKVLIQEASLWTLREGGYAGRTDNIYESVLNLNIVSDFKTSKKPKKADWIKNYFMQLGAYHIAYFDMFKKELDGSEIWISNEQDVVPQIFEISKQDTRNNGKEFLKLVKEYHKKNDKLLEKELLKNN